MIELEIELPYDPEIPLLGIHTKETRSERDKQDNFLKKKTPGGAKTVED